jgi:hypothetical protein
MPLSISLTSPAVGRCIPFVVCILLCIATLRELATPFCKFNLLMLFSKFLHVCLLHAGLLLYSSILFLTMGLVHLPCRRTALGE